MDMPTKDEVAEHLARTHFAVDSGVVKIFRLVSTPEREADPEEPIKLLEVYEHAFVPSGVAPVYIRPHPASGVHYPTEIIQIAPEELPLIGAGLSLPDDWAIDKEYPRPTSGDGADG